MKHALALKRLNLLQAVVLFFITLAVMSGCSVKLISSYDENTDKAVTKLQRDLETFFVTVESQAGAPECKYDTHRKFYQDSVIAISAIEVRAKALEKNEITVEQVGLLKDSLDKLEQLHKMGCFTKGQVTNLRDSFNASITAILKLELAKKRGKG